MHDDHNSERLTTFRRISGLAFLFLVVVRTRFEVFSQALSNQPPSWAAAGDNSRDVTIRMMRAVVGPVAHGLGIIVMMLVLAISGILIWKFAPVDEAIDSILPSYNSTGSVSKIDGAGSSGGGGGEVDVTTDAPTASPAYQFIPCEDNGQACCNDLNTNCSLRANEILYATLHNAMATFDDGFIFGPNHQKKLEEAIEVEQTCFGRSLEDGRKEKMLHRWMFSCLTMIFLLWFPSHGICSLEPREIVGVMENVNTFLDANPTEIIVFIYQVNSEVDQPVDLNAFYERMALDKLYVHPGSNTSWPTLGEFTDPAVNKVGLG
jgi:hypothetical protein